MPDDRFLSWWDGRPRKLTVQTVDSLYETSGNTTYRRTNVRNISPWMLRIAFWAMKREDGTSKETWVVVGKCVIAAVPLSIMVNPWKDLKIIERR